MTTKTYRIYLRNQEQQVTDKTTTTDNGVADTALRRLVLSHKGESAAAVISVNGKQQQYIRLDGDTDICERCKYRGPFVDDGETCPHCALVQ